MRSAVSVERGDRVHEPVPGAAEEQDQYDNDDDADERGATRHSCHDERLAAAG
jgi:hypothetical protein